MGKWFFSCSIWSSNGHRQGRVHEGVVPRTRKLRKRIECDSDIRRFGILKMVLGYHR